MRTTRPSRGYQSAAFALTLGLALAACSGREAGDGGSPEAAAAASAEAAAATTPAAPPASVLLVTLDTTRADRLGCYGHPGGLTPELDRLAASATLFTQAIAQAAVTPVSHASIFTGLNPYRHGLRVLHGLQENRLSADQTTLAEVLRARGYATAAFVSAFPVSQRFGLDQGFDDFDADFPVDAGAVGPDGAVNTGRSQRRADATTDLALAWLAGATEPFLLWVHYFDPHDGELAPPADFLARHRIPAAPEREAMRALYDAEVAYMDQELGRLLAALTADGRLEAMVVAVVSDHGEGLGDHDWWTHGVLYQEQIRVPMIVKGPGPAAGRRVDHLVRTLDLAPTLLALAGVPTTAWPEMEGRSLAPLVAGAATGDPGLAAYADSVNLLSYNVRPGIRDVKDDVLFALVADGWKYIHHLRRRQESELYHLASDPRELRNLYAERPQVVIAFQRQLQARLAGSRLPSEEPMEEADRERLRALGYVDPRGGS